MLTKILGKIFRKNKIELSVFERIILLEIIDKIRIDFIIKKVLHDIENKLSFSDKELSLLDIRSKDGQVIWKTEYDKPKYICFGVVGKKIVLDCLLELEEKLENKDLIDKFTKI